MFQGASELCCAQLQSAQQYGLKDERLLSPRARSSSISPCASPTTNKTYWNVCLQNFNMFLEKFPQLISVAGYRCGVHGLSSAREASLVAIVGPSLPRL